MSLLILHFPRLIWLRSVLLLLLLLVVWLHAYQQNIHHLTMIHQQILWVKWYDIYDCDNWRSVYGWRQKKNNNNNSNVTTTTANKNKITHTPKLGNNCDSFRGSNKRIAKHADDKQIYSMEKKIVATNKRADTQWLCCVWRTMRIYKQEASLQSSFNIANNIIISCVCDFFSISDGIVGEMGRTKAII